MKNSDLSAVEEMQIKIAFLEDSLAKLSEEYFTQQKEIQRLSLTVDALIDKLNTVQNDSDDGGLSIEERPPHY